MCYQLYKFLFVLSWLSWKYVLQIQPHWRKCVYGGAAAMKHVHIQHFVPCMLSNFDNEYVKRLVGWLGTFTYTHAINYSSGPQPRFIMNLVIYWLMHLFISRCSTRRRIDSICALHVGRQWVFLLLPTNSQTVWSSRISCLTGNDSRQQPAIQ